MIHRQNWLDVRAGSGTAVSKALKKKITHAAKVAVITADQPLISLPISLEIDFKP
jgi:hypothetical protein